MMWMMMIMTMMYIDFSNRADDLRGFDDYLLFMMDYHNICYFENINNGIGYCNYNDNDVESGDNGDCSSDHDD